LLGTLFNDQGDRPAARRCYEESLVLSEELGNALRLANVLGSLAVLHGSDGDFDAAEALFEKSLALSRKQGNRNNIAANLCNLSLVSARLGAVDRARTRLSEALTITEDIGSKALGVAILNIAAVVAATSGQWTHAARHYGASQAESGRQGLAVNREDEILAPLIAQARRALARNCLPRRRTPVSRWAMRKDGAGSRLA
jgi:tetratricopeptide (TPR) repeat protein